MDTSGSKILAADDDRIVRRIVVAKLSGLGYEVTQAEDGQEALSMLEEGYVPDLLITDSLMPRMTGLELVRSIRSSPDASLAKLPVIMLTSRQGEQDIIEGLLVTHGMVPGLEARQHEMDEANLQSGMLEGGFDYIALGHYHEVERRMRSS